MSGFPYGADLYGWDSSLLFLPSFLYSLDDALGDGWLLDGTGYLTCRLSSLWFLYFGRLSFS